MRVDGAAERLQYLTPDTLFDLFRPGDHIVAARSASGGVTASEKSPKAAKLILWALSLRRAMIIDGTTTKAKLYEPCLVELLPKTQEAICHLMIEAMRYGEDL
jgi:hypothetical protein